MRHKGLTVFYGGRRHLKATTTRDIALSRTSVNQIYISETPTNRGLFNECLKSKKEHNYKYIWSQYGAKILLVYQDKYLNFSHVG
jgi:hypothetical protein